MTAVRLEPAAPQSQVKHSTTDPLRSLIVGSYMENTRLVSFDGTALRKLFVIASVAE